MGLDLDAYVTAALFQKDGSAAFALGDGTVRFEAGETVEAHPGGVVLAAAAHPGGEGLVTGGDDGRLAWVRPSGVQELARAKGWIDVVASSPASALIAFAAGRELRVLDSADPRFERVFPHERTVADAAFDDKGRRIAVATYGGAALWWARIADQKPQWFKWAGSHTAVAFSPDSRFLISAMQENQLHGWRLADGKDLRMGGYPAKVKSLAFLAKGSLMATSGADGAVVWPMGGAAGPMGKEAVQIGHDENALVTRVAGRTDAPVLAAGLEDGRVWIADLKSSGREFLKVGRGSETTALCMSRKGDRLAWGDADGGAGVFEIPGAGA